MNRKMFVVIVVAGLVLVLVMFKAGVIEPPSWMRSIGPAEDLTERDDRDLARAARRAAFVAENRQVSRETVVFLGSSTIEFWPIETSFPGKSCLNRGIGSETAREILARLDISLPAIPPRAVIVYAGSADLRAFGVEPARIAEDVADLIRSLRARTSESAIAILAVLSGRKMSPYERKQLDELNGRLRALAASSGVEFIETDVPPLRDASGSLPDSLSKDRWHLNQGGYEALTHIVLSSETRAAAALRP